MRKTTALMIAATMFAAPALAQDNLVTGNTTGADAGTMTNTDPALATNAPTNGLAAGPGTAPVTTDPAITDPAYGEPARGDDDDGFPWGVLGLLGLAGLLGRRRRDNVDEDRTTR